MNFTSLSSANAFRLEEYTDNAAGAIIRMIPIDENGIQTPLRLEQFVGKTHIQTNRGPVEIRFGIEATSLADAFAKWLPALQAEMGRMESAAVQQRIVNGATLSPSEARALAAKKPPRQ